MTPGETHFYTTNSFQGVSNRHLHIKYTERKMKGEKYAYWVHIMLMTVRRPCTLSVVIHLVSFTSNFTLVKFNVWTSMLWLLNQLSFNPEVNASGNNLVEYYTCNKIHLSHIYENACAWFKIKFLNFGDEFLAPEEGEGITSIHTFSSLLTSSVVCAFARSQNFGCLFVGATYVSGEMKGCRILNWPAIENMCVWAFIFVLEWRKRPQNLWNLCIYIIKIYLNLLSK